MDATSEKCIQPATGPARTTTPMRAWQAIESRSPGPFCRCGWTTMGWLLELMQFSTLEPHRAPSFGFSVVCLRAARTLGSTGSRGLGGCSRSRPRDLERDSRARATWVSQARLRPTIHTVPASPLTAVGRRQRAPDRPDGSGIGRHLMPLSGPKVAC